MVRRETCDCLDERAPGIAAKMIFGENTFRDQTEVSLNAIAFHGMEVGTLPKIIAAESPTARRQVIAMMELVTVSPYFATLESVAPLAAPGRPNKKTNNVCILRKLSLRYLNKNSS